MAGSTGNGNVNGPQNKINRHNTTFRINLQPFWPNSPATWFILAEAQFALGRITSKDLTKYRYVVAALPQGIAESVMDILHDPPASNLYAHLKKVLIERHSVSIECRIRNLLSDADISDRKPSTFFHTLKALAHCGSGTTVDEEVLLKIWLSKMPQAISMALIPYNSDSVVKILGVADRVWEALQNFNVALVANACPSGESSPLSVEHNPFALASNSLMRVERLKNEISELNQMIASLKVERETCSSENYGTLV